MPWDELDADGDSVTAKWLMALFRRVRETTNAKTAVRCIARLRKEREATLAAARAAVEVE